MVIQLKVHSPTGVEKIMDLCDREEQMKEFTVKQLKEKITKTLRMTDGELDLVVGTEILEEGTLIYPKIKHMTNIHTVLQLPGGI